MIGQWRKNSLNEYFDNLKDYYINCEKPSFRLSDKVNELTQEEKEFVNDNINLESITGFRKEDLVNSVLKQPDKFNFARHLLLSENIELEVNNILENKGTFIYLMEQLFLREDLYYSSGFMLATLYKRGYQSKECDELFLKEAYKNLPTNETLATWCTARSAFKLNDYRKIEKAFRHENVLFTILSFKMNKPIGIHYPNLLGVANNAIQHYRENGDILIKAMTFYKVHDEIIGRDKKNVFKNKMADFEKYKPIQDEGFLEIITTIFPELK